MSTVLVIDDECHVADLLKAQATDNYKVSTATTCAQALDILQREPVVVVVSEIFVGRQDARPLISALRYRYPLIVTLVCTSVTDADIATWLMTEARVFRVVNKTARMQLPVNLQVALRYRAQCRRQPKLLPTRSEERFYRDVNPSLDLMTIIRKRWRRAGRTAGVTKLTGNESSRL